MPVVPNSSGGCLGGAVDPGGDLAERGARRLDEHDRQAARRRELGAGRIGHDRDRAARRRLGCVSARRARFAPGMPTKRSPGCRSRGAERHAGELDAVDRARGARGRTPATSQASERGEGCSGRRTGGIRELTLASLPVELVRGASATLGAHQVSGRVGAGSVDGVIRKVLMTCFMIALKAGAAAAEVFIVSGFTKVTTMAYCGLSAGHQTGDRDDAIARVAAVLGDLGGTGLGGDPVAGDREHVLERALARPWAPSSATVVSRGVLADDPGARACRAVCVTVPSGHSHPATSVSGIRTPPLPMRLVQARDLGRRRRHALPELLREAR